jgi:hypothetical protein
MGVYTVPTKGQRTASRKKNKTEYIQMGAYTIPIRPDDRIPTFSVPIRAQRRKPFGHTRIINKPDK